MHHDNAVRRYAERKTECIGIAYHQPFIDQPLNIVRPCCMKALHGLAGIRKLRAFGMLGIKDQPIRIRMLKCELEKGVPDLPRVGARISPRIKCASTLVAYPPQGTGPSPATASF